MTDGEVARSCTDIDEAVLNYAEMAAIASGNPLIKEKMEVDAEVSRLELLKRNYTSNKYKLEKDYTYILPEKKERIEKEIEKIEKDIEMRDSSVQLGEVEEEIFDEIAENSETDDNSTFKMLIRGEEVTERKQAGKYFQEMFKQIGLTSYTATSEAIAEYAGFKIGISKSLLPNSNNIIYKIIITGNRKYEILASKDSDVGNIIRIQNCIKKFEEQLIELKLRLQEVVEAITSTKEEYEKPFTKELELTILLERQKELNELLTESDLANNEKIVEEPIKRHRVAL